MRRVVSIGELKVGGKYPVRIKGMLKGSLRNKTLLLKEAMSLEKEGAEALRVAVKTEKDSAIGAFLKKKITIPLVADVHFNYRVALRAIDAGFDGIRLNPLNIYKKGHIREVVREAKKAAISLRVGVNSGGFKKSFNSPRELAEAMVDEITRSIRIVEEEGFFDIIASLKASTVNTTILANRMFAKKFRYPLHIGVTATGPFFKAVVKSSIGIGNLLREGLGDIIRVSLTAPSFWEIRVAQYIVQSLELREFSPEIISCPTCSRCQVDLIKIVEDFKKEIKGLTQKGYTLPSKIALMGCEVNGPGEAQQADIGVAFGKGRGVIFERNRLLCTVPENKSIKTLIEYITEKDSSPHSDPKGSGRSPTKGGNNHGNA